MLLVSITQFCSLTWCHVVIVWVGHNPVNIFTVTPPTSRVWSDTLSCNKYAVKYQLHKCHQIIMMTKVFMILNVFFIKVCIRCHNNITMQCNSLIMIVWPPVLSLHSSVYLRQHQVLQLRPLHRIWLLQQVDWPQQVVISEGTLRIELKILTFARWEMDCPLDRYCLKVSGTVVDAYGYGREVAVRGCPLISLLTRLEEGCHRLG